MDSRWTLSYRHRYPASWFFALTLLALMTACGGESGQVKPIGQYDAGSKTQEDLETLLKNDSRVEDHNINGETVTVTVNETFTSAPYGMQQRALWNWYNTWQAAKSGSKNAAVVVESSGSEVARWNHADGYKPVTQAKE